MPILGVMSKARVPVKLWTPLHEVESEALDQLAKTASLPFVFKHVAVMPDVHYGRGSTVGSVIATEKAICPACVGVDIGCGMMAVRLPGLHHGIVQDQIAGIRHSIERSVPVGHEGNRRIESEVHAWQGWEAWTETRTKKDSALFQKALSQLGSLGGGNHFIEICLDENLGVWVMLHSGSRNVGKTLAERHIDIAKKKMEQYFIHLPDPDLAYLVEGDPTFREYWLDLQWCQDYARANREEMMRRVLKDLSYAVNEGVPLKPDYVVNCHHNYVEREHHYGRNVLVTRKGAVRARLGDYGIIPGSMGTRSFIVRGLGNENSFHSCSHGAGRRMSRSRAKAEFSLDDLARQTAGVECRKDIGVLDEIPGAYKDIDRVMGYQVDLVETVATLKQIMCIKG